MPIRSVAFLPYKLLLHTLTPTVTAPSLTRLNSSRSMTSVRGNQHTQFAETNFSNSGKSFTLALLPCTTLD